MHSIDRSGLYARTGIRRRKRRGTFARMKKDREGGRSGSSLHPKEFSQVKMVSSSSLSERRARAHVEPDDVGGSGIAVCLALVLARPIAV